MGWRRWIVWLRWRVIGLRRSLGYVHHTRRRLAVIALLYGLVVLGNHALLVGDVIAVLRTLALGLAVSGTHNRTHHQAGRSTRRRVVVAAATHGRPHSRTQQGAHNRRTDRSVRTGVWANGLLRKAAAILVFLGKQF